MANGQDVFKYEDEDTNQMHYMSGVPGQDVEGGWQFESPEGKSFELTYKANAMGFQPVAEYLPVGPDPIEDTVEVKEAKTNFYSMFKAMEERVKEVKDGEEQELGK